MDIPRFFSERGTGWAWNTSAIGRAIFRPATERRVSREARLPTRFSHVFRRRLIYRESAARLLSIPTWHLSSENAPASPRRRKNAVYKQRAKANEQKNANHQRDLSIDPGREHLGGAALCFRAADFLQSALQLLRYRVRILRRQKTNSAGDFKRGHNVPLSSCRDHRRRAVATKKCAAVDV